MDNTDVTPSDTYLGIDFGGTKILVGEADANAVILGCQKYPSGYLDQRQAVTRIREAVDDYIANRRPAEAGTITAMGLGLVGRINGAAGIWYQIDKHRNDEIPLADVLSKRYGIPCVIDNDVRCAAAAEARFGYGRQSRDFIYINIGTGIAACFVTGGHVVRGGSFNAGEVGHTQVGVYAGVRCACGRADCAESIAAGVGIDLCARLLAPDHPDTSLHIPEGGGSVNAHDVFGRAGTDTLCGLLTDNAARAAANLVMNLVRVTDPDTVILGGGLVADDILFTRIISYLHAHTMRFVTNGVVRTKLDPDMIGLLGACALAMN